MKILKVALFCICFTALTQSSRAQEAAAKPNGAPPGAIGYIDPLSGNFKPLPQTATVSPEAQAAIVPSTGKLVFNFTITIISTLPATSTIVCGGSAEVFDGSGIFIIESASVAATRSGATASCTVNIPYSWLLSTPTTDRVVLNISVGAGSTAAGSVGLPNRSHSRGLGTIPVPVNLSTTTEVVKVTI